MTRQVSLSTVPGNASRRSAVGVSTPIARDASRQMRGHARWDRRLEATAKSLQHVVRITEGACVADGRSRTDHAQVVADNVRNGKRQARGRRRGGELAAFDRREMFAHRVERVDVGPLAQQPLRRLLLVVERNGRDRHGHQRRCAAGQQHKQLIVRGGRSRQRQRLAPASSLAGVGTGCPPAMTSPDFDARRACGRRAVGIAGAITSPPRQRAGQATSAAAVAMPTAALPTASTRTRAGPNSRCPASDRVTRVRGSHARSAARTMASRSERSRAR